MVQVILLRSLVLSSIMCLVLSVESDYVSHSTPKDALSATATDAASLKNPNTNNAVIHTPTAPVGLHKTILNDAETNDADMMPDEPAPDVNVPAKDTPVVSDPTTSNNAAKGTIMPEKPLPAVKAPASSSVTSPVHKANTPLQPQAVPALVPGITSADGKCTCPGAPDVPAPVLVPAPVPAKSPLTTGTQDAATTPPPVTPDVVAPSTTDTSSTNALKVPAKMYFAAVAALVGMNSLCT